MDIFLRPNWMNGCQETLEYLTTIFTTDSGKEQRSSERISPRRVLKFSSLLSGDNLRDVRYDLDVRSDDLIAVPEPVVSIGKVASYAPAGSHSVQFDKQMLQNLTGKRVCIAGYKKHIFATVESVAGNQLNFAGPISSDSNTGDDLRVCVSARLHQRAGISYISDDVADFQVELSQNPGEATPSYGTGKYPMFMGREVLIEKPNWANPPSVEVVSEYDTTDFNRGIISTYRPINFTTKISQLTFLGQSRSRIQKLIDMFNRMRGRSGEFWCPSWTSDFRLVSVSPTGIIVAGPKVALNYSTSTVNRALAIRMMDDSWHYKYISRITTGGTNSTITFVEPFNIAVDSSQISGIYWLNVCRFASDGMVIQWITDEIAQTVLQVMTLEALPAEVN